MSTQGGTRRGKSDSGGGRRGGGGDSPPPAGATYVDSAASATLTEMLGHTPSDQTVRAMVGAPPDAQVSVRTEHFPWLGGDPMVVKFSIQGAPVSVPGYVYPPDGGNAVKGMVRKPAFGGYSSDYPAERILYRGADGKLEMLNSVFRVLPELQGQGIGARMLATEAKTLSRLGVARIGAEMAGHRGSSDQGYRVWPLLGYNTAPGKLEFYYRELLKDKSVSSGERARVKRLGKNLTISELYGSAEGRAWWGEHGVNSEGYFDLTPGSRSLQTLQAYMAAKGIDWTSL